MLHHYHKNEVFVVPWYRHLPHFVYCVPFCQIFGLSGSPWSISLPHAHNICCITDRVCYYFRKKYTPSRIRSWGITIIHNDREELKHSDVSDCDSSRIPYAFSITIYVLYEEYWPLVESLSKKDSDIRISKLVYSPFYICTTRNLWRRCLAYACAIAL